jgi:hypothetical protein
VSRARRAAEHLLPWAALIGGGLGWALSQQIGSASVFDGCTPGTLTLVIGVGLVGLLLAAVGGVLSFRVWKRGDAESEGRRFVALVMSLVCALLALAILLQTLSVPVIASCYG